jgi:hypothetical protein
MPADHLQPGRDRIHRVRRGHHPTMDNSDHRPDNLAYTPHSIIVFIHRDIMPTADAMNTVPTVRKD